MVSSHIEACLFDGILQMAKREYLVKTTSSLEQFEKKTFKVAYNVMIMLTLDFNFVVLSCPMNAY